MTVHEVLVTAYRTIENPTRWTQKAAAITREGERVETCDDAAVAWCVSGAMRRAAGDGCAAPVFRESQLAFCRAAGPDAEHLGIGPWNDRHTHTDVLAALRAAIAATAPEPDPSLVTEREPVAA